MLGINRRTLYRYLEPDGRSASEDETGGDVTRDEPSEDSDVRA